VDGRKRVRLLMPGERSGSGSGPRRSGRRQQDDAEQSSEQSDSKGNGAVNGGSSKEAHINGEFIYIFNTLFNIGLLVQWILRERDALIQKTTALIEETFDKILKGIEGSK
jgi:hypothetical protein